MARPTARTYHHGDLRQTLIDTAVRHIDAQGTEGLSLRALAREAGVSATAPYRHFENRTALLAAIATEGFQELHDTMDAIPERLEEAPVDALFEACLAYVEYARYNMVKYHLMFGDAVDDFSSYEALMEAGRRCYLRFEGILAAGIAGGGLMEAPVREMGGTVWSLVHGMAGVVMAAERKRAQVPPEALREVPPLQAQQQVLLAPERTLARLLRGLVTDPAALARIEARAGLA